MTICTLRLFQEGASYQEMMDVAMAHVSSFFAPNSTLMRSLEETRINLTEMVSQAMSNSSLVDTWNKTLQETIQSI